MYGMLLLLIENDKSVNPPVKSHIKPYYKNIEYDKISSNVFSLKETNMSEDILKTELI
jgi:hypothetical protein